MWREDFNYFNDFISVVLIVIIYNERESGWYFIYKISKESSGRWFVLVILRCNYKGIFYSGNIFGFLVYDSIIFFWWWKIGCILWFYCRSWWFYIKCVCVCILRLFFYWG